MTSDGRDGVPESAAFGSYFGAKGTTQGVTTPEEIAVEQQNVRGVIRCVDVFRVRHANIRRRHTLIGLSIGAGTGIEIGAAGENIEHRAVSITHRRNPVSKNSRLSSEGKNGDIGSDRD